MELIEIFKNGAILIEDPKNRAQFKVNGQRLKPYIEMEPQGSTSTLVPKVYNIQDLNLKEFE